MREAYLPPEFAELSGSIQYLHQVMRQEYASSCPKCGGTVHQDGEWPDRLRLFLDEPPRVWCRRCGYFQVMGREGRKPDPEAIERWRRRQLRAEEARRRSAERAISNLERARVWQKYHEEMDAYARYYWQTERALPESLVNRWQLGCNYNFKVGDTPCPCMTIPIFDSEWHIKNVKCRIIEPKEGMGKYRYEIVGQTPPIFLTNPDVKTDGMVYVIEGEIKAMTVFAHLRDENTCVVGLPGSQVSKDTLSTVSDAEKVVLLFDPDATEAAVTVAKRIGLRKCFIVSLPDKVDDMLNRANIGNREVKRILASGTPAWTIAREMRQ